MKRWLAKSVVFRLLGAVVNVAVAWGYAAWSELRVSIDRNDPNYIGRLDEIIPKLLAK